MNIILNILAIWICLSLLVAWGWSFLKGKESP